MPEMSPEEVALQTKVQHEHQIQQLINDGEIEEATRLAESFDSEALAKNALSLVVNHHDENRVTIDLHRAIAEVDDRLDGNDY